MFSIRAATQLDRDSIRDVHLSAVSGEEAPIVAALASNLLNEDTRPETFAFVAEMDGTVIGHIAFSPVMFDTHEKMKGYILAPLGVIPECQNNRIGSKLVEIGIEQLLQKRVNVLFVYGDPNYYNRFGFNAETAINYLPPYKLQYPFGWLAIALNEESSTERTKLSCVSSLLDPDLW